MSVSSVSSVSAAWEEYEEYLEKLRSQKQQARQAAQTGAAETAQIDVKAILEELEALRDEPEQLKARADEIATDLAAAAKTSSGPGAKILQEVVSDLKNVAASGDLSVMTEKIARGKPGGVEALRGSGLSGSAGASMKWIEALLAGEDDEDSEDTALSEALSDFVFKLQKLGEKESAVASSDENKTASSLNSDEAALASGRNNMINQLRAFIQNQTLSSTISLTA